MKITRLDLDGVGSPRGLAARIHEVEDLPLAVPLEELCKALDIVSIKETETFAFEAALVTDATRSSQMPRTRPATFWSIAKAPGYGSASPLRTSWDIPSLKPTSRVPIGLDNVLLGTFTSWIRAARTGGGE